MTFLFIVIYWILFLFNSSFSSSSNTLVFSAGPNSYVAFDSWRPCLNGYVRFDIRTNTHDGTLAYIDDRGKFDFFYLKLIEGKPRLLFNLGNDRQALNVNIKINDDQWHTILIKRDGQTTSLSIDNGLASNSTITHSEDLYFGGSTHNEYQASPFYFGGIPSVLERPSSGNLSSFDVYMQPRFRGRLRNLIYKNCTNSRLVQPVHLQISGGVSIIPNHHCSGHSCGPGICLLTDTTYKCLCDETDYQGEHCEYERQPNELTFNGKTSLKYPLTKSILSSNEIIQFQFKTNHYNALLFQLIENEILIQLKQGQILIEYRLNNQWYESSTKDLYLIDNQWHYVQIKRKYGQITMMIDEYHLQLENELKIDRIFQFTEIHLAGNTDENIEKFYGCLKDIILIFNDNITVDISQYFLNQQSNETSSLRCSSLLNPIEFLSSSSFLSLDLSDSIQQMTNYQLNISFHFQTYSADAILLYTTNKFTEDFLGFDLIDGFFYFTINIQMKKQRQEIFHQRFNDGQTHFMHLNVQGYQGGLEFSLTMNYRQNIRIILRNSLSKIHFHTMTIGGINPLIQWLPTNYWSGIMHRGFLGCFSNLELNNEAINLTKYINNTNNNITPKSGPCSMILPSKRECLCEHDGECRLNSGGTWSCDCSKTGYTGRRCEHATYHIDLNQISIFEMNTNMQWSEQINDITFGLQALHDQENFLQFRPCRQTVKCDSINFSIRNGLLRIHFYLGNSTINITGEYPFLLDNQWHYIHLYRIDSKLLLHIDHHIAQQRVNLIESNHSLFANIWLGLNGNKQIRIENLRLYDQSINSKIFWNNQYEQIQFKHRPWKPANVIAFYEEQDSYIAIQLNDVLCQECELETIYFDFRTTELTGLIFFANIQTTNPRLSYSLDKNNFDKDGQYLFIKLVDGQLHLTVIVASLHEDEDEIHQIQTKTRFNDGHWHHISLHRGSNHHLEFIIDSREYSLLTSVHFLDTIYFGRPSFLTSDILPFNHIHTLKTCLASLTLNSRTINLRDYLSTNSPIRQDCNLDSPCPLRYCQNTGICRDRLQCNCQHTSFQGEFCTEMKIGYFFNEFTSGLIFDQPYQSEKKFLNYQISFGLITKMITGEILRVSDQIQIELFRGHIRIKLAGNINNDNDFIQNDMMINDGKYHLIQIEYNQTGYLRLIVDKQSIIKQLTYRLSFDKPLLLLIGQNPAFRHGFQGQLYGLQSDIYSVFDLISPTFQRISYSAIQDKTFSSSSFSPPSILYPSSQSENDFIPSVCSAQSYDDICFNTSNINSSPLSYPNLTLLTSLPKNQTFSSSISTRIVSRFTTLYSTSTSSSYQEIDFSPGNSTSNSTHTYHNPPLIISIRTPLSSRLRKIFHWQYIWVILIPVLCGIGLCILLVLFAFIKYRRKDVGVYEVEEAQRFRPLIVELTPSPGERHQENINSTNLTTSLTTLPTTSLSKKEKTKSHKRKPKRKKSLLTSNAEQREFYI